MLTVDNVSHNYGAKTALKDISFTLEHGLYGLIGPNGAGKTTLINVITGLLTPSSGRVMYNGISIKELGNSYYGNLGYLPQNTGFYKNFTAKEYLEYISLLKKLPRKEIQSNIQRVLHDVNLQYEANMKIGTYSGGMKRRVGIAQALLNNPRLLILDEPTAGLDPNERIRLRNILSGLSKESIILLSTHIISDIEYSANGLLLLKKGKLILKDDVQSTLSKFEGRVFTFTEEEEIVKEATQSCYVSASGIDEQGYNYARIVLKNQEEKEILQSRFNLKLTEKDPRLEDVYIYYFNKKGGGV